MLGNKAPWRRLSRKNKLRKVYIAVFILLFMAVGIYTIVITRASGNGVMSLSPATSNVALGSNVTVTIMADSQTVPVNAANAELTYDTTKVDFVSVDTSSSAYGLGIQATGGNGKVTIARSIKIDETTGNVTPLTGNNQVARVTFKVKAVGSTSIQVADTSSIFEHGRTETGANGAPNAVNILSTRQGTTLSVSDKTSPSVPTSLSSPSQEIAAVNLSWAASSDDVDVTGYKIYRNGTQVGTSSTTSYKDSNLTPSTTYNYTVSAYDAAGNESAKSSAISAATKADTVAPSTPATPTLNGQSFTTLQLTWVPATDNVKVAGYYVYRNGQKVGTVTSGTSFTDTGLTPGTSYSYSVSAYDTAGNESARSTAAQLSTKADTTSPTTPANLTSPLQAGTSISLSWQSSTDDIAVKGYNVYRNNTKVNTSATTSFTDTGLTPGVQYTYAVSAYDASGNESARSSQVSATIPLKTGDVNKDNKIDILDLSTLLANYGKESATFAMGDVNKDGVVNIYDLSMLLSNWKK